MTQVQALTPACQGNLDHCSNYMHSKLAAFVNTWMRSFGTAPVLLSCDCVWLWMKLWQMCNMRYVSFFSVMFSWHMQVMLLIDIRRSSSAHVRNAIANVHISKWSCFKSLFSVTCWLCALCWMVLFTRDYLPDEYYVVPSKVLNIQVNIARIAEGTQDDARCLCRSSLQSQTTKTDDLIRPLSADHRKWRSRREGDDSVVLASQLQGSGNIWNKCTICWAEGGLLLLCRSCFHLQVKGR